LSKAFSIASSLIGFHFCLSKIRNEKLKAFRIVSRAEKREKKDYFQDIFFKIFSFKKNTQFKKTQLLFGSAGTTSLSVKVLIPLSLGAQVHSFANTLGLMLVFLIFVNAAEMSDPLNVEFSTTRSVNI
jgi:hypothetical protein